MRDIQRPGRSVLMSTEGMAATSHPMATQTALDILKQGGNALDAAIAACAVQCVTEPQATGIGGDCFLLYHEAKTGQLHGYNGSGRAPGAATVEAYHKRALTEVPERGILSVSVPGAVEAWHNAIERLGSKGLDELLQPAIHFASHGYAITPVTGQQWAENQTLLAQFNPGANPMLVHGKAPAIGSRHVLPELATTLRQIARDGKDAFYTGAIAEEIIRFSKSQDGLLSLEDLATHQGEWVTPLSTHYGGVEVFELPPNCQGITALQLLNIMRQAPLGTLQAQSSEHLHFMIEAFKLATAERNRFLSDPRFSNIPLQTLLSDSFASELHARIRPDAVLPFPLPSSLRAHRDTVYISVVDKDRNAASVINSLYYPFGSMLVAGSTGVVLQNRGAGFVLDETHFNCIAPAKRPLHTLIPAMARRDGELLLCFGVMGGQYQAMGHACVLSNLLDFGMDLQEAIDAPRFLPEDGLVQLETGVSANTRQALERLGHQCVQSTTAMGGAQAIYYDAGTGVLHGASDCRKDGCAIGY